MRERSQASATRLPASKLRPRRLSQLVRPVPGSEAPDVRDQADRPGDMVILLAGAGVFWLLVVGAALYLMH